MSPNGVDRIMRHYQKLNEVTHDESNDILRITSSAPDNGMMSLSLGREGIYVSISATYGPLEIALRPRQHDLARSLAQIKPTDGLTVTRMVGTGQAHLELGLSESDELVVRTTIVADATGHFAMNMVLSPEVRQTLFTWLDVKKEAS
jgi:hypothetical protein